MEGGHGKIIYKHRIFQIATGNDQDLWCPLGNWAIPTYFTLISKPELRSILGWNLLYRVLSDIPFYDIEESSRWNRVVTVIALSGVSSEFPEKRGGPSHHPQGVSENRATPLESLNHLVGGPGPPRPEKYESIGMIIPNISGKRKLMATKPPTSHPAIDRWDVPKQKHTIHFELYWATPMFIDGATLLRKSLQFMGFGKSEMIETKE